MHALATSISSSPPPKKTNENGRGGGGGGGVGVQNKASARSGPPARRGSEDVGSGLLAGNLLLSPAERAKLRKGNPGSSLLGRGGGGGGGGGDASSSLVSKRGAGAKGKDGPHNTARAIGDKKHQQQKGGGEGGGDGYGGGGKWKREDDREGKEASDGYAERGGGMKPGAMPGEVKRRTPGTPGRRPKKTKVCLQQTLVFCGGVLPCAEFSLAQTAVLVWLLCMFCTRMYVMIPTLLRWEHDSGRPPQMLGGVNHEE